MLISFNFLGIMKKSYLLSLIIALCFTIQCWAEFNPTSGMMYALKEKTTGLYLDIQTLGIHEPGHTTNSLSLNVNPCIIYFEGNTIGEGNTTGPWKLKNINGTYAGNYNTSESDRTWNTKISNEPYDWIIAEGTGGLTIAKDANNFIGWDNNKTITAGSALYNNAEGGNTSAARLYFELVEYTYSALKLNGVHGYYTLRLDNFYMNFTVSGDTKASLQESPTYLYALPSANHNYLIFQDKADPIRYLGHPAGGWPTEYNCKVWKISEAENDGLVLISRHAKDTSPGNDFGTDMDVKLERGLYTNVNGAKKWSFEGIFDYPTKGQKNNGKIEFTSEKIYYYNPCNTLRFTLTESDAKYNNGKKRMSFDSFELFDADGNKIELQASYFKGNYNKTYAGMLDGVNAGTNGAGCCCGVWGSPDEGDDYFEILLPKDVDLGGAFSFKFVTENTDMNAEAFKIETLYLKKDYAITITYPSGKTATVTYDGQPIVDGDVITAVDGLDTDLFAATEISGYTWSVVVDDENLTVTLVYTEAPIVENPDAVVALVNRIGGTGTAENFKFVLDPSINSKQETFVLGAEDGKILIKGTTISAITTGLGWYLNNIAKVNIAWNSLNEKASGDAYATLPDDLPLPADERHVCDAKYRYYLNYCTFGYSMATWTWKRWQQEIDWMALHGINMPLQIVGLEEVWRKFLTLEEGGQRKYNYTDAEAKAFVAGPAFTAWWGMNNLEGWGGTEADGWGGVQNDAWYIRQQTLATKILTLQRDLGMQPVLPGFSGMVPTNFTDKTGIATEENGGDWGGFHRPHIIDPTYSGFADIAKDYYQCLNEVMGESQYYSMDPFHEGGSLGSGKYTEAYKAIHDAMEVAKRGSQWVIQQWQWYDYQKVSVSAVPAGKLIVLDLFSDGKPAFDSYSGYAPQDAVFCAIPNFGGRSGLMGRLQNVTDNYFSYKAKYRSIKGIGAAPEAIEQTPVTYDLIFQLPWMNGQKPDVAAWVDNYAVARYGQDNAVVKEAWSLLRQGPLNYGADAIQGPVEDVWAARPNLDANAASTWGSTISKGHNIPAPGNTYTKARRQMLIDATHKLLAQKDALGLAVGSVYESNYNYDLVEFGGAVMADYAHDLLLGIKEAKTASNTDLYNARKNAFLQLILDMDEFRGTNLNFRLGKWTQEARAAAGEVTGAQKATADWYEFNNARTIITTWGDKSQNSGLKDYSYRSWQGLLKDYYYPRWKYYFDNNCTDPASGYFFFEWNWAHGMTHQVSDSQKSTTSLSEGATGYSYTREPVGNTVDEAQEMLAKYIIPVLANGYTHYAYRYLDNDLSDIVTVVAKAGETIDLTPYFGALTGVESVDGDVVGGTTTEISVVSINADAADGVHLVTITLNDGTTLVCSISINPRFNGIYTINYKNGDADAAVFIAYNTVQDLSGNVGYKLIATSNEYSTQAEGDKHFLITPSGAGFKISAQGKYLKSPNLSAWNHLLFSDNPAEAGVYLFKEVETDVFNMRDPDTGSSKKYVNVYDHLIFGNDLESKENLATFTFKSAKTFPFTMTPAGMATLCLPFNVKMPASMYAYDFEVTDISDSGETDVYNCVMKVLVRPGEVLKAGTPVIVKALEGDYEMEIVAQDNEAKTNLGASLLRGNFVAQTLKQSNDVKKFIFTKLNSRVGFYRMDEGGQIGANKCWMEWDVTTLPANAKAFQISFDEATDIDGVSTEKLSEPVIYDLAGRKLKTPQRGFNIVNGKKVIVK